MKKKNNNLMITLLIMCLLSMFLSSCKKDESSNANTVKDIDGNVYQTVTIGTQVWMVENLKVTKFNDGTDIPLVTDGNSWSQVAPAYCWYNNDAAANKTSYGALYNWHAVNTGKLAPVGWHVPTSDEWETLSNYLQSSGKSFSAILGGFRSSYGGSFSELTQRGHWWSSTVTSNISDGYARSRRLEDVYSPYVYDESNQEEGQSVRCLKN